MDGRSRKLEIRDFVREMCEVEVGAEVRLQDLWESYVAWGGGMIHWHFSRELGLMGFRHGRRDDVPVRRGLKLAGAAPRDVPGVAGS